MRHAFLSKRAGDSAASVGFRRLRGYISSASCRAPASASNLPTLFEFRQLTETEMRVADAIAPISQARYYIAVPVLNESKKCRLYRFLNTTNHNKIIDCRFLK
jgi:hypothetical protein